MASPKITVWIAALLFVGVGVAAGSAWAPNPGERLVVIYVLAILNLCCVVTGFFINRIVSRQFDVFDLSVYVQITFAVLFPLKTLYIIYEGGSYLDLGQAEDVASLTVALLYALVWLLLFYAGYFSRLSGRIARQLPRLPALNARKVRLWAPLLFAVGLAASVIRIHVIGGVTIALYDQGVSLGSVGLYPLNLLASFMVFAFFVSLAAGVRYSDRFLLAIAIPFGLMGLGKALSSFSKGQLLTFGIGSLVSYHWARGTRPGRLAVGLCVLASVSAFSFFDIWRSLAFTGGRTSTETVVSDVADRIRQGLEPGPYESVVTLTRKREGIEALSLIVRDTEGLAYAETLRNLLIMFVPRALWPEKPIVSEGVLFGREYLGGAGLTAYTMTIPGSAYRNLHVPGIILSGYVIGVALATLYRYLRRSRNQETAALVYAVLFPALAYFVEVGLLDLLSGIIPLVAVALVIIVLVRARGNPLARRMEPVLVRVSGSGLRVRRSAVV
jgi:hypothetical protein